MGANYESILATGSTLADLLRAIERYLTKRRYHVTSVCDLKSAHISDEYAVLLSSPADGIAQVLASDVLAAESRADWFENNLLAAALSESCEASVHVWSLDSSFVAGYSIYEGACKVEADVVFCKSARSTSTLMEDVPTPAKGPGRKLATLIGREAFDFASHMQASQNLEVGLAEIVSQFGLDAHLVDFLDAIDGQKGIAVQSGELVSVDLFDWKAIRFARLDGGPNERDG